MFKIVFNNKLFAIVWCFYFLPFSFLKFHLNMQRLHRHQHPSPNAIRPRPSISHFGRRLGQSRPFHSNHTRDQGQWIHRNDDHSRPHTATITITARRNTPSQQSSCCVQSIFEPVSSKLHFLFVFLCSSRILDLYHLFFKLCHFATCHTQHTHTHLSGKWRLGCASRHRPQPPTSKLNSTTTAS